jgi:hypothetical protein
LRNQLENGFRMIRSCPRVAAAIVLTLALDMGGNMATLFVTDAALLPHSSRVISLLGGVSVGGLWSIGN